MKKGLFLSVVMPCYNEGKNIYENISKTIEILEGIVDQYEIICVDDGSNDNTYEEIKKAEQGCTCVKGITYKNNQGKGYALKLGVHEAKGEMIAFVDADLELSPKFLKRYIEIMDEEKADVVIGSKMHKESIVNYPLQRKIFSMGYYILLKILFHLNVKDTQTGLKLFKASIIKKVMPILTIKGYAFDIEILAIINRRGYKIVDAPIELMFSREKTMGRIHLHDIFGMFIDTLKIFVRLYIEKRYDEEELK